MGQSRGQVVGFLPPGHSGNAARNHDVKSGCVSNAESGCVSVAEGGRGSIAESFGQSSAQAQLIIS
jgi:hypothetical protein